MIDKDAVPTSHVPPYKPIDIRYPGRRRVVTREMVMNNTVREPDPGTYDYDGWGTWTLKEGM